MVLREQVVTVSYYMCEKCVSVRMPIYKMQVKLRGLYLWSGHFFKCLYESVMSLNGLSFVSARPAPQPCVSVLMERGIQECLLLIWIKLILFNSLYKRTYQTSAKIPSCTLYIVLYGGWFAMANSLFSNFFSFCPKHPFWDICKYF